MLATASVGGMLLGARQLRNTSTFCYILCIKNV